MGCQNIKELILEYPDGDLTKGEKLQVETHLRECKECNLFFAQSNEVWNLLDMWDGVETEKNFVSEFWDRISEEDRSKGKGIFDFFRDWKYGWGVVAAVIIILFIGIFSVNNFHPRRASVVFTEMDRKDDELLIRLDNVTSRDTARALEIYGPWDEEI